MEDDRTLLVRLDERTAAMAAAIRRLEQQNEVLDKKFSEYVTQHEMKPIRSVVYGFIALVLTGFVSAVAALVWKK